MFYKKQLETYNEIGDDKLEIFYSKYENIFSEFDKRLERLLYCSEETIRVHSSPKISRIQEE